LKNQLKVLHVSYSDTSGGAAHAAYRLHKSLLIEQVGSQILVHRKKGADATVSSPANLQKVRALLGSRIDSWLKHVRCGHTESIFSPAFVAGTDLDRYLTAHPTDLVNLHWTCAGMLSIESLAKIPVPVIWTLHDMWSFTGGCHYSEEGCENYQVACGNCPLLTRRGDNDLSARVLSRKRKAFEELNMTLVSPSRWMAEKAQKSSLFHNTRIRVIPNGLDLSLFSPTEKSTAKQLLNLPTDRMLILFGAMDATINPRKGFDLLLDGLNHLSKHWRNTVELVVFGSSGMNLCKPGGFNAHFLGEIHDDTKLAALYSAASLMIVPSRQDNLPNTVSESQACGTPVVAFNIGGLPEMIEHEKSGYLAKPFDTEDLAQGIEFVLNSQKRDQGMSLAARKCAEDKFSGRQMARKYLSLYQSVLTCNDKKKN